MVKIGIKVMEWREVEMFDRYLRGRINRIW